MKLWNSLLAAILLTVVAFGAGHCIAFLPGSTESAAKQEPEADLGWTCPMHPQIRVPDPVPCPLCGMDLVPIEPGENLGPRELSMSPAARQLAAIETTPVVRKFVTMPVRMVGKIDYDETSVRTIAARVAGRIDRMFVDYHGIPVKRGDHLVSLYSPTLLSAQEELLEAKKRLDTKEKSEFLAESNAKAYASAGDKLLLWGFDKAQVDAIEKRGTAEDHMEIHSPASGVIVHKKLDEVDNDAAATEIYTIADLTRLWLRLDAYEQDLPWLRFGQQVTVRAEAIPGTVFRGWISFIAPVLDERSRTVKVRVNLSNPDGRLKPGMFVRAVVQSRIADSGRVLASHLAGKWISPMHPEIVKDGPGKCDVCGMDLRPAASFGYVNAGEIDKPLVIPASAVLVTGRRAVVYVQLPGKQRPTFEGREVILGPRAGESYIIRAGLQENENVVTNGAFRIDSSMQILAKPSMMSMPGEGTAFHGQSTAAFRASITSIYTGYLKMQEALAADHLEPATRTAETMAAALEAANTVDMPRAAARLWYEEKSVVAPALRELAAADSLEATRTPFDRLSQGILAMQRSFGHAGSAVYYEAYCPMALNHRGAAWLQIGEKLMNPYFGAKMLHCGERRTAFHGIPTTIEDVDVRGARMEKPSPPPIYVAYFTLQRSLASDDFEAATTTLATLRSVLQSPPKDIPADSKPLLALRSALSRAANAKAIDALRREFATLSTALINLQSAHGHSGDRPLYRLHCPMAFDNRGADWLQPDPQVRNPYFGASMPRCGKVQQTLAPREK